MNPLAAISNAVSKVVYGKILNRPSTGWIHSTDIEAWLHKNGYAAIVSAFTYTGACTRADAAQMLIQSIRSCHNGRKESPR